jgi:CBS domain-containing protein
MQKFIQLKTLLMKGIGMRRLVRDIMNQTEIGNYPSVEADATVGQALHKLRQFRWGTLVVLQNENLVGVFSERDFATIALDFERVPSLDMPVADVMVRKIVYVTLDYTLEECLAVMQKSHVRHLPVIDKDKVVGLVSMRHIMELLIDKQLFITAELTKYITGTLVKGVEVPKIC